MCSVGFRFLSDSAQIEKCSPWSKSIQIGGFGKLQFIKYAATTYAEFKVNGTAPIFVQLIVELFKTLEER
jgi:hypothetical protein